MKRLGIGIAVIGLGVFALSLGAVRARAGGQTVKVGASRGTPVAAAQPSQVDYRGMAIQINSGDGVDRVYIPLLREIAGLGANSVLISPAAYMEHAKSQGIWIESRRCPSHDDFVKLLTQAKGLGLRVILMPTVLLSHPRGSEWRGIIEPPDWPEWWRQYRDFVKYFAEIARDGQADTLMIGSELVSTEKQIDEWHKVIEVARGFFPGGKLGYSANWDHYEPVKFWDKLDCIGMTSYYTLAEKKNPTVDDVVRHWVPIRDKIMSWQKVVKKPLILTEVGWCSQEGAGTAPWNYYQNQKATPEGHEEQRRLYEGFLRAWDGVPGLAGVIWWEWTPDDGGANDFGYTPRNKPAEHIMRKWFSQGAGKPGQ